MDNKNPVPDLLQTLELRGITLRNRVCMAAMCQYSAQDGLANDWHLVHYGSRAAGGVGLVILEATAISDIGRISPADLGIWNDGQINPLKRISSFVHQQGAIMGIQLAHAGRKASCDVPRKGGGRLKTENEGGWTTVAPSAIPFNQTDPLPHALSEKEIIEVVAAFEKAARRAVDAGIKLIELHAAHGYLLHQFLSPLSNKRTDEYGGSLENRMRLLLQVTERLRTFLPADYPLWVRISATDWSDGGWDLDQSVELAKKLKALGVDLIDVSTGGLIANASIPVAPGFQVPFSKRIRAEANIKTGAVGLITEPQQANEILTRGEADVILLGRALLRDPYWPIRAQQFFGAAPSWPSQYGYAVNRR